jgi:hypothetical protein
VTQSVHVTPPDIDRLLKHRAHVLAPSTPPGTSGTPASLPVILTLPRARTNGGLNDQEA